MSSIFFYQVATSSDMVSRNALCYFFKIRIKRVYGWVLYLVVNILLHFYNVVTLSTNFTVFSSLQSIIVLTNQLF